MTIREAGRGSTKRRPAPMDLNPFAPGRTMKVRWKRVAAAGAVLLGLVMVFGRSQPQQAARVEPAPPVVAPVVLHQTLAEAQHELETSLALARDLCLRGDHFAAMDQLDRAQALARTWGMPEGGIEVALAAEAAHVGGHAESLDHWSAAIQHDPARADAWLGRARARYQLGQPQAAMADATRAVELDPRLVPAWLERAQARMGLGDLDGAHADVDRALELDPTGWETWSLRARLRMMQGDLSGAQEDIQRARGLSRDAESGWRLDALETELSDLRHARR